MKGVKMYASVLLFLVFFSTGFAQSQWKLLGLDSQVITALAVDDRDNVIAGSKSTISLYYQSKWYTIPSVGLPVEDILVTGPDRIVLALGGGSNSDGVYQGDRILKGPPFYFVKLVDWMMNPTALAKTTNSDVVFVGSGHSVAQCYLDTAGGGYFGLNPIKIPKYSFGVETPCCGDLQWYSGSKTLFAGGYDKGPLPGPGNLLWGYGDSLRKIMPANVSAMTEGIVDWGEVKLFIGTIDSGIYVHTINSSKPPEKWADSPDNDTINDILHLPNLLSGMYIYVAVSGGVYVRSNTQWLTIGTIPAEPLCLAYTKTGTLYAGTKKGVYAIDLIGLPIKSKYTAQPAYNYAASFTHSNNRLSISFVVSQPQSVGVSILNVSGRTVAVLEKERFTKGTYSRSFNLDKESVLGTGVYYLCMTIGQKRMVNRIVFVK